MTQYLVAIEKVKARMGYPPNELGSNAAVYSGMVGAQLRVQSELRTLLPAGNTTEIFFLDESIQSAVVNGRFLLNLGNGFVSAINSTAVARKWNSPDVTAVPTTDYVLRPEKGVVEVSLTHTGKYVAIEYDYGFSPADVAAGLVPEWLEDVIMSYTPIVLKVSNVALPQTPNQESVELLLQHIMSVLSTKRRDFSMGLVPI